MNARRIGPLNALVSGPEEAPTIVLMHGYGADAGDLASLASSILVSHPVRWVFPDAPLELDFGGRAWFALDQRALERAQHPDADGTLAVADETGRAALRFVMNDFFTALNTPWSQIIVGGFSQGAMLAVDLALRAPQPPRGLVVLSGTLTDEEQWTSLARTRQGLPFFQSHGRADAILPYKGAVRLETLLSEAGLRSHWLPFEGGHSIPPEVILALGNFIDTL